MLDEIFKEKPIQWGLRGDPFLWDDFEKNLSTVNIPETEGEFSEIIDHLFYKLTGSPITIEENIFVERYSKGGMSTGMISIQFWVETAIPLLKHRYLSIRNL